MVVTIPVNKYFNEKVLLKDQNFEALQAFVREAVNRGMRINNKRIVVDFRTSNDQIMVHSYPPILWARNMKTMNVEQLHNDDWINYRKRLTNWKKSGGIKVREMNPLTGQVHTVKLSQSGIVIPG